MPQGIACASRRIRRNFIGSPIFFMIGVAISVPPTNGRNISMEAMPEYMAYFALSTVPFVRSAQRPHLI